jgi:hypothetical protein
VSPHSARPDQTWLHAIGSWLARYRCQCRQRSRLTCGLYCQTWTAMIAHLPLTHYVLEAASSIPAPEITELHYGCWRGSRAPPVDPYLRDRFQRQCGELGFARGPNIIQCSSCEWVACLPNNGRPHIPQALARAWHSHLYKAHRLNRWSHLTGCPAQSELFFRLLLKNTVRWVHWPVYLIFWTAPHRAHQSKPNQETHRNTKSNRASRRNPREDAKE